MDHESGRSRSVEPEQTSLLWELASQSSGSTSTMISTLIASAFQTGYLSVESEGLLRQVLSIKSFKPSDLDAIARLQHAIQVGQIKRESRGNLDWLTEVSCYLYSQSA